MRLATVVFPQEIVDEILRAAGHQVEGIDPVPINECIPFGIGTAESAAAAEAEEAARPDASLTFDEYVLARAALLRLSPRERWELTGQEFPHWQSVPRKFVQSVLRGRAARGVCPKAPAGFVEAHVIPAGTKACTRCGVETA